MNIYQPSWEILARTLANIWSINDGRVVLVGKLMICVKPNIVRNLC